MVDLLPWVVAAVVVWSASLTLLTMTLGRSAIDSPISPIVLVVGLAVLYGIAEPARVTLLDSAVLAGVHYEAQVGPAVFVTALWVFFFAAAAQRESTRGLASAFRWVEVSDGSTIRLVVRATRLALLVTLATLPTVGVGARSIIPGLAGSGSAIGYIVLIPQTLFGLALCLRFIAVERSDLRLAYLGLLTSSGIFVLSGTRYTVVVAILAVGAVGVLRRSNSLPSWRVAPLLMAGGFAVIGVLGAARSEAIYQVDRSETEAALTSLEIFVPQAALHRFVEVEGFELGSTYSYVVLQAVPRVVWPERPAAPLGRIIQAIAPSRGVAFPIWGEAFLNFGWPGVAVHGFVFGSLVTRVWVWMRRTEGNSDLVAPLVLLASALLINLVSRGYFVQAVYTLGSFLAVPTLILFRCCRRSPVSSRALKTQRPPTDATLETV